MAPIKKVTIEDVLEAYLAAKRNEQEAQDTATRAHAAHAVAQQETQAICTSLTALTHEQVVYNVRGTGVFLRPGYHPTIIVLKEIGS